ncbi:hypothetical protein [Paenibacillus wenxiniae]|uniref:Uncharacterized protein n=1 Tax=Paenibacillus wenxiniae TaxID=1636843 RepID=A0ABW4RPZ6_9BACL
MSKKFLCHDFWNGFYAAKWLSFDEIKINTNKIPHVDWAVDYLDGIWTIQKTNKYKEKDDFYYETVLNFTKNDLIDCFKEYLGYTNHVSKVLLKDNRRTGIEVYEIMIDMLGRQKVNLVNRPFDIHAFHLLYEHKKLVALAVKNYIDNPIYLEKAEMLVNVAEKLRNLVMYCNISIKEERMYKRYDSIIATIKHLKIAEEQLFDELINKYDLEIQRNLS